jgi:hypothetical protein
MCISPSSAGLGPSQSSSVFSGLFIPDEVDGVGDKSQEIPQQLMYILGVLSEHGPQLPVSLTIFFL